MEGTQYSEGKRGTWKALLKMDNGTCPVNSAGLNALTMSSPEGKQKSSGGGVFISSPFHPLFPTVGQWLDQALRKERAQIPRLPDHRRIKCLSPHPIPQSIPATESHPQVPKHRVFLT